MSLGTNRLPLEQATWPPRFSPYARMMQALAIVPPPDTSVPDPPPSVPAFGEQLFTTPGTYTFTVPDGVFEISAILVGGGGGGAFSTNAGNCTGGGGGGGGLRFATQIPTQPGEELTVVAGAGGVSEGLVYNTGNGQDSSLSRGDTVIVSAGGGEGGKFNTRYTGFANGGAGTPFSETVTGGDGGQGGSGRNWLVNTSTGSAGAGGGGAGGYSGNGGAGGSTDGDQATDGAGGGGGGGAWANWTTGGSGGGVGLYGEGESGIAGIASSDPLARSGKGGSGGGDGNSNNVIGIGIGPTVKGGSFGGGGGGMRYGATDQAPEPCAGGDGAVRIFWGA